MSNTRPNATADEAIISLLVPIFILVMRIINVLGTAFLRSAEQIAASQLLEATADRSNHTPPAYTFCGGSDSYTSCVCESCTAVRRRADPAHAPGQPASSLGDTASMERRYVVFVGCDVGIFED